MSSPVTDVLRLPPSLPPTRPVKLRLGDVTIDEQYQPRVEGLDVDLVGKLMDVFEVTPPMLVLEGPDGDYILLDGFHRYAAAQNLGLEEVQCDCITMADLDSAKLTARDVAFFCNSKHGKPLTLTDRRRYAEWLLQKHGEWSNGTVAQWAGLAPSTVQAVRAGMAAAASEAIAATVQGSPSVEYRTDSQGRQHPVLVTPQRSSAPFAKPSDMEGAGDIADALDKAQGIFFSLEAFLQQVNLWRQKRKEYLRAIALIKGDEAVAFLQGVQLSLLQLGEELALDERELGIQLGMTDD